MDKKHYSTYIFDLDGPLLDTLGDLAASTHFALRPMCMPERSVDEVRRFVGNGVERLIRRALPDGSAEDVVSQTLAVFKAHYLEHGLDTTAPYEGVTEMLRQLKGRGCRIAVVSNKFDDATRALCRHFFPDTVSVAVGEREGIARKPSPDTVMEALRQLGVSAEGAVYVGDSEVDILTADNCRMPCISVLWGFRDRALLEAHGGVEFVSIPSELY